MKIFTRAKEALLLSDTSPKVTALSMAVGVALAFSPFPGLQFIFAIVLTHWLRLNSMVVIVGILVHNPWTFFPIHLSGIVVGDLVLYRKMQSMDAFREFPWHELGLRTTFSSEFWQENGSLFLSFLLPFFWGHMILAALMAVLSYYLTLKVLKRNPTFDDENGKVESTS